MIIIKEERKIRNYKCINDGWEFIHERDNKITNIKIPHTWNAIDGQDGGNDYYRGSCIYKKVIDKKDIVDSDDEHIYLEFRGVNESAIVIINDVEVCQHNGGYSTFRVEITDNILEKNEIKVLVHNKVTDKIYPQRADFTFYGGIYRDVFIVTVPKSHFDLEYYGGPGIMVTPKINNNKAFVNVKSFIKGEFDKVNITIDGIGTLEVKENFNKLENDITEVEANFTISDVHLWKGIEDPYLYKAKAELIVDEEIKDIVTTKFGCREYSFDEENGFILNGRRYKLNGVSRHQDRKGIGNALTKEMHEEDIDIILEMGSNSIRLAHYQHDQYFYDLCDEKGIIVWAEIPYISEHMANGRENTISQMKELIVQNYNHPSIICWGLSNEISLTGVTDDLIENHNILNDLAHKMDSTRVTTMANLFMLETDSPLLDIPDIMSYNLYYGWYVGELQDNDRFFDEFHEKYPKKVIGLSEYGADCFYKLQSSNPKKGDFSEQYQCLYHEHMLKMFSERPYIWSTYLWNMFDFAADARAEAGDDGINHKGLVTFDRKIRKDAFYLYKAWWSNEKFVHLCGSRYVDRVEDITEIKVYSNLNKIALYKDGQLFEEQDGSKVFIFKVSIDGEHIIEIKGVGKDEELLVDKIIIKKVEEANTEYCLNGEPVKNWFEDNGIELVEGYFSIADTLGDIKKVPEGKAIIDNMMLQMSAYQGDMAKDVVITDNMVKMMDRFTVDNLLKQAGGISKNMVIELNKQLNKIKKLD